MRCLLCALMLALVLAFASGCETMKKWTGDDSPENVTFYYDFDDVLIPSDMSIIDSERFLYENDQFRFGKIPVKGRVDQASLATFFVNSMKKDGWTVGQTFKAERAILFFEKQDKSCVIKLIDGWWYVTAEILVVELKSARSGGARPAGLSRAPAPMGGPAGNSSMGGSAMGSSSSGGAPLKEKGLSQ